MVPRARCRWTEFLLARVGEEVAIATRGSEKDRPAPEQGVPIAGGWEAAGTEPPAVETGSAFQPKSVTHIGFGDAGRGFFRGALSEQSPWRTWSYEVSCLSGDLTRRHF